MYELIEQYRNGAKLSPAILIAITADMAEMRRQIEYRIPRSQREDFVVVGHGRTLTAAQCGAE